MGMKIREVDYNGQLYAVGCAPDWPDRIDVWEVDYEEVTDPIARGLAEFSGKPTTVRRFYPVTWEKQREVLRHCGPKFSRSHAYQRAYHNACYTH